MTQRTFVLLSLVCAFAASCSKKETAAATPSTKLTFKGTLGVEAQSAALTPPTGTWVVYCEQVDLATNSCSAAVDATSGAFEATCEKLAGVPFQCFLKKSDVVVSPVVFDDQWIVRTPPGTLEANISFDADSSYAAAEVVDGSEAAPVLGLTFPANDDLQGKYKVTCETSSTGFSAGCEETEVYFNRAAQNDLSRYGIWDSQANFEACGSEYSPSFKLVFNGEATSLHRMSFDSNSVGQPMMEAAEAFFSEAPTSLTATAEILAEGRQANIEYVGFSQDDLSINLMVDLLSFDVATLNDMTTVCTAYDALSTTLKAKVDLATATLCTLGTTSRAAAITWLKNTREKSCVPKVHIDRVYDSTAASWYSIPVCFG